MAKHSSLSLLLFVTALIILNLRSISATTSSTLPPSNQDIDVLIQALVENGRFTIWAKLLAASKTKLVIPTNATFFVPTDAALSRIRYTIDMNPYLVACHITPGHLLVFSDLYHLKPLTLLPTLVPSKTILITSTLPSNYRIDSALISHPNLYLSSRFVVHAIDRILELHPQRSKMPPLLRVGNVLGAANSEAGA